MHRVPIILGTLLVVVLPVFGACAPTLKPPPESELISPDAGFAAFTDPIGKFSIEYPSGWSIYEVSGEDAVALKFSLRLGSQIGYGKETSIYVTYSFHRGKFWVDPSLEQDAEWYRNQWAMVYEEDLISKSGPNIIGDLVYWECKFFLGEEVHSDIYCDWEDGLLSITCSFPKNAYTDIQVDILQSYALHMLSTFQVHGPRLSQRVINILRLVNEHRQLGGLSALELNEFMSDLARQRSNQLSLMNPVSLSGKDKGFGLSHYGFDEASEKIFSTLGASITGENLAMGYNDSAASLVDAWMNSPEHRDNIMNPRFRRTGIGIVGNIATQIFSD